MSAVGREWTHNVHRESIPWTFGLNSACGLLAVTIVTPSLALWATLGHLYADSTACLVKIAVAKELPFFKAWPPRCVAVCQRSVFPGPPLCSIRRVKLAASFLAARVIDWTAQCAKHTSYPPQIYINNNKNKLQLCSMVSSGGAGSTGRRLSPSTWV